MEDRGWYASGKERQPGRLLKYALIVLTGVVFAVTAVVMLIFSAGEFGKALLWSVVATVVAGVISVIAWFIYKSVALKK